LKKKLANFTGKLVFIGFGSIAKGVLPLFVRHLEIRSERIMVFTADEDSEGIAREQGISYQVKPLTEENYRALLEPVIDKGDFLINLSVNVSSLALIELCRERGAFYLDTSIEPWEGGYTDQSLPVSERCNYGLREHVKAFARANPDGPTAVVTMGANPGLVSTFVKRALLDIATANGIEAQPTGREQWAQLAQRLGIKAIHVAERDTQSTRERKQRDEFVNTWSVEGFISEGLQPAELGWGSHERHWPEDGGRHEFGCGAAIYLNEPGASVRVRSWTPLEGAYHGFLITHSESIALADYLTVMQGDQVVYRPTVHYAYHPCDDAIMSVFEMAGNNWQQQPVKRIMRDEIDQGMDELGVLLVGNAKGVYWYGSRLTIAEARKLAPYNNATSLQVAAGVLAGVIWALRHPDAGVVEPEALDHEQVLDIARPYLGELAGVFGEWTPLQDRNWPIQEDLDLDDPWQFKNIRVK
jgi:homospermidine synthase